LFSVPTLLCAVTHQYTVAQNSLDTTGVLRQVAFPPCRIVSSLFRERTLVETSGVPPVKSGEKAQSYFPTAQSRNTVELTYVMKGIFWVVINERCYERGL